MLLAANVGRYTGIMPIRVCLVWLLLALLPLRGWAVTTMAMPMSEPASVEHRQAAQPSGQHANHPDAIGMPCHEAPAEDDGTVTPGHACKLCDLCHSAVTLQSAPLTPAVHTAHVTPRPGIERDTGRNAVGGLERPPRPSHP